LEEIWALSTPNSGIRADRRRLQFYLDQLGFKLLADTHISIGRWAAVAPPDGTAMLALVTPEPDSQEYKLIGRSRHVVLVAEMS